MGKRNNDAIDVISPHGEKHRNNNGERLINFCVENNLIVTNTFYKHKNIHKYTREVTSRKERSIIDFVLINRSCRKEILDVKVRRGPEIYSDHYLVVAKVRIDTERQENGKAKTHFDKANEAIKTYKLQETVIANKFKEVIEGKLEKETKQQEDVDLEQLWCQFKEIILTAAKETCGTIAIKKNKKQTKWWNQEIKNEVKIKKEKWKLYLNHKTKDSYTAYKQQRIKVKEMVIQAKQQTWEEFGMKMEADSHTNQKLFYRVLKSLRKGKHHNLNQVKAKDNTIITEEKEIMERWKEYFRELLNPDEENNPANEEEINYAQGEEEDDIQIEEVVKTIKNMKKGKAAGHDKINAEMLKNLGVQGIEIG